MIYRAMSKGMDGIDNKIDFGPQYLIAYSSV